MALLSFGGPAGQIAVMHRTLVEERRWLSERRFLHALNYCMLLPGPEAQQLATYSGWLLHGWRGGLTAGMLFILPGFLSILVLSVLYAGFQGVGAVDALFYGLKPAVMAVVVQAVLRVGGRALGSPLLVGLALASFVAIHAFAVPFPMIVTVAALLGWGVGRVRPLWLLPERSSVSADRTRGDGPVPPGVGGEPGSTGDSSTPPLFGDAGDAPYEPRRPGALRSLAVLLVGLFVWLGPLGLLSLTLGHEHVLVQEGWFFSEAAVFTFGGAYAVLAHVAQQAVEVFGWLRPGEMLDGLGMAETTPGPLIQVVQFVGFLAAHREPGSLDPILSGVLGSCVVTWATFAPCFLWIFLGAPYLEALRGNRALTHALTAVTSVVVGVIGNLALWFALHTLFGEVQALRIGPLRLLRPTWTSLDPAALGIALVAAFALFRLRAGLLPTLLGSVLLGGALHALGWVG